MRESGADPPAALQEATSIRARCARLIAWATLGGQTGRDELYIGMNRLLPGVTAEIDLDESQEEAGAAGCPVRRQASLADFRD